MNRFGYPDEEEGPLELIRAEFTISRWDKINMERDELEYVVKEAIARDIVDTILKSKNFTIIGTDQSDGTLKYELSIGVCIEKNYGEILEIIRDYEELLKED